MTDHTQLAIKTLVLEEVEYKSKLIHDAQCRLWAAWAQIWFDGRRGLTPTAMHLVDLRLKAGWPNIRK